MNPPPRPYSCDGHDDSKSGEVDDVVIQFLKELERSSDAREVLVALLQADILRWPASSERWPGPVRFW